MSTHLWIGTAVGLMILGGLLTVAALYVLSYSDKGPRRYELTATGPNYFEETAPFAVTAEVGVPGPIERVWNQVEEGGYLGVIPFVSCPQRSGDRLATRTPVLAFSEKVVRSEEGRELVAMGTGASLPPIFIKSFAQRWELAPEGNQVLVRWTIAITPRWCAWIPLRWMAFIARPFLRTVMLQAIR
ncbi:SRPBCC family protein [Mycobacterium sp. NPDC050853]|uniref:SRPBCC family protein n=1 Tax=Mycobacteriaceae TaxID=1762 RepID=UPI0015DDD4AA|nr:SRPBCC family protein [Mycobacteroides sp. LB1]